MDNKKLLRHREAVRRIGLQQWNGIFDILDKSIGEVSAEYNQDKTSLQRIRYYIGNHAFYYDIEDVQILSVESLLKTFHPMGKDKQEAFGTTQKLVDFVCEGVLYGGTLVQVPNFFDFSQWLQTKGPGIQRAVLIRYLIVQCIDDSLCLTKLPIALLLPIEFVGKKGVDELLNANDKLFSLAHPSIQSTVKGEFDFLLNCGLREAGLVKF